MSLREEVKEAMALVADGAYLPESANLIRNEKNDTWLGIKIARAALEVLDTYEEVPVDEFTYDAERRHYLRMPDDHSFGKFLDDPRRTVYMKKQVSEPAVEELARVAVELWDTPSGMRFSNAMNALAERLEKP